MRAAHIYYILLAICQHIVQATAVLASSSLSCFTWSTVKYPLKLMLGLSLVEKGFRSKFPNGARSLYRYNINVQNSNNFNPCAIFK
ncbi:hypothetical protein VTN96DRAFT_10328 [Rasamsonia emersonii]